MFESLTHRVLKLSLPVLNRDLLQRLHQLVLPSVQVVRQQVFQLVLLRFKSHSFCKGLLILGLETPDVIIELINFVLVSGIIKSYFRAIS